MINTDRTWQTPTANLTISDTEIHLWRAELDRPQSQIQNIAQTLSDSELQRADRFRFDRDKIRFIARRAALRGILSRYLNVAPNQVQFSYGPCGKPEIADNLDSGICFNLSDSQGLALYAVTRGRKIGVDLEQIRDIPHIEELANRFFSKQESTALQAVAAEEKIAAFFNCWTRKEAYIKAMGDGLSFPLDKFSVSLIPGEPAKLLNVDGDRSAPELWYLKELVTAPNYIAAIAVECKGDRAFEITNWEWGMGHGAWGIAE
ncbi:MAG: 4'-phosphopantetheinyl transferase superfamily protein [Oscillatoriaceae cyanobacterium Prado104]|jgi:4'-phosphopantetheinyl transferase|nr:4'-phosphopantetheinyl transferase superfamily protein [Oscillatoriaceae cyanobacterium Prado104]